MHRDYKTGLLQRLVTLTALVLTQYGSVCLARDALSVTLAWDRNSEPNIVGYHVLFGTKSRVYTNKFDVGNNSVAKISNLSSDRNYYFAVTAYTAAGIESLPSPEVRLLNVISWSMIFQRFVYGPSVRGAVNVASGDVNGDGTDDIITAIAEGGRPRVKVISGRTGARLPGRIGSFLAYSPRFSGGVNVASGDVNGDGFDDIITAMGKGGRPRVKVFNGRTGARLPGRFGSFLAYSPRFSGGVNVASGDVNADGSDDIITAMGRRGSPHIRVFSGRTGAQLPRPIGSFFAYSRKDRKGVNVSSGDVNGDGTDDIITAMGRRGSPHIRVFSGRTGAQLPGPIGSFLAYSRNFRQGLTIASGDVNGDGFKEIITGTDSNGRPHVRVFGEHN